MRRQRRRIRQGKCGGGGCGLWRRWSVRSLIVGSFFC
jgi:hypothetical protein